MSVGQMIRTALAGRSQKWLAAQTGLSEQYVSEIVRRKKLLSHEAAKRIGEVLKVKPRDLLVAQLDDQLLEEMGDPGHHRARPEPAAPEESEDDFALPEE